MFENLFSEWLTRLSVHVNGEDDSDDHADGGDQGQGDHVGHHLAALDAVVHHLVANLFMPTKIFKR
jgi:hypothetical protein